MTRFTASLASFVSVVAFAGSAFAFTAPMPTKAQEKQVTQQIQRNVQRTGWYKGFVKAGETPKLTVSYAKQAPTQGMVGSGFPVATAMVSAGKSFYGTGLNPQKQRQFIVTEKPSGKFVATGGKWNQLYTALGQPAK
jgi:hypothetical protein